METSLLKWELATSKIFWWQLRLNSHNIVFSNSVIIFRDLNLASQINSGLSFFTDIAILLKNKSTSSSWFWLKFLMISSVSSNLTSILSKTLSIRFSCGQVGCWNESSIGLMFSFDEIEVSFSNRDGLISSSIIIVSQIGVSSSEELTYRSCW